MESQEFLAPLEEPVSRAGRVVDALRLAILRGELAPGCALVERDLADRLGVSKTPVREALKVLAGTGLVSVVPFRGASVREIDLAATRAIYEARLLLEPPAVALAVPVATGGVLDEARDAFEAAARAGEQGDFGVLSVENRRFHRALYGACPNEVIRGFLDELQDQIALISAQAWRRRSTWRGEADEHLAILVAVEHGDAAAAQQLLHDHLHRSLERLGAEDTRT